MSEQNGFAVKLDDVGFSYKEGGEIYKNFSLSIANKSKISLMGANGAGKSTLGKLIARLL